MATRLRTAHAQDANFLVSMLAEAAAWHPDHTPPTKQTILATPELARYVVGWPRAGDLGVIAETDQRPIGAAWLRFFTADAPGYGFVAADIPELAMGVDAAHRGRGVGTGLLTALVDAAAHNGIRAMSLSVAATNPARRLYERAGFHIAESQVDSMTMVRRG